MAITGVVETLVQTDHECSVFEVTMAGVLEVSLTGVEVVDVTMTGVVDHSDHDFAGVVEASGVALVLTNGTEGTVVVVEPDHWPQPPSAFDEPSLPSHEPQLESVLASPFPESPWLCCPWP